MATRSSRTYRAAQVETRPESRYSIVLAATVAYQELASRAIDFSDSVMPCEVASIGAT
jgi:hypothetical protein